MTDWEKAYKVKYPETFEYRRAVLDAIIPGRWQLSPDGTRIKFDINIDLYSYHERHIIFFARDPSFRKEKGRAARLLTADSEKQTSRHFSYPVAWLTYLLVEAGLS
jgi:hypothetical protein